MKRILSALFAFAAFFAATCYAQSAPIGVCVSNVALTISNGFTAPVPFALVTLCSAGSTQTTCTANMQPIFTSTALSTTTPNNPFKSDVGGNYFFCAPVGHYALMISGSQGIYFVNDIALVDDWSQGGTVSGPWSVESLLLPDFATTSPHCLQVGLLGEVSSTTFACGNSNASGTVTNVAIGPGWPSWLTPNITNPTSTPSINATVAPIPNAALANPATTVNGQTCTLGATCTISQNVTVSTCSTAIGSTQTNSGSTYITINAVIGLTTGTYGEGFGYQALIGSGSPSIIVAQGGQGNSPGFVSASFDVPAGYSYSISRNDTNVINAQQPSIISCTQFTH
jgi:hypothetical protein